MAQSRDRVCTLKEKGASVVGAGARRVKGLSFTMRVGICVSLHDSVKSSPCPKVQRGLSAAFQ